jgi:uncharacterized membrane protein
MTATEPKPRRSVAGTLRDWLLTGLLVLAPTAITMWIFFRLLNWVDNLLGRYFRFAALDYKRIPGIGLLATLIILALVGGVATWLGSRQLGAIWDRFLSGIPGLGILYGSTKSVGEALLSRKGEQAFKQVVLVPWPHERMWRVGFVTGRAGAQVRDKLGIDVEVVFVPHTPNPASGFVHYVPRSQVVYLDWPVEEGLKVIVSGGLVQPGGPLGSSVAPPLPATTAPAAATATGTDQPAAGARS